MIQKTIHYCWFGGGEFSPIVNQCMKSWQECLADFTIKQWDESNSPLDDNIFIKDAYKAGYWAFVSDYVRLYALHREGGIYLDTDMFILKSLDDFLECEAFLGMENPGTANCSILGSRPGHDFTAAAMKAYGGLVFSRKSPVTIPNVVSNILKTYGLQKADRRQEVFGVTVYPTTYFYPWPYLESLASTDYRDYIQSETVAVHLWEKSWKTEFDYLKRKEFGKGFAMMKNRLKKQPIQPLWYYKKVVSHTFRYLLNKMRFDNSGKE